MVSDTGSYGPTEEAVRAGNIDHPHTGLQIGTDCSEAVLRAAYPLIRERVCQELASAMRAQVTKPTSDEFTVAYAPVWEIAAEFVERFGKADTDG